MAYREVTMVEIKEVLRLWRAGAKKLIAAQLTLDATPEPPPLEETIRKFIDAYHLTPRESDVLTLLALGEPRSGLARKLGVEESSVKTHLKHMLRKTGDADVGELVARLLRAANGDADAHPAPRPSNDER